MKKAKSKPFNLSALSSKTQMALASNNHESKDPTMSNGIMLSVLIAIEDLQLGRLRHDKFAFLVQMNAAALSLCQLLKENGKDYTKATRDERIPAIFAAAHALGEIGTRWADRDRFVATGNELRTLRTAAEIMANLTETVPRGLLLRSFREAEAMGADFYAKGQRSTV